MQRLEYRVKKSVIVVRSMTVIRLFSSPELLHTCWGPSNLLPATYSGLLTLQALKIKDDLSHLSSAEVNNEWNSCVNLDRLHIFILTCSVLGKTEN